MGKYVGLIEIEQNKQNKYYNFNPIAIITDSNIKKLTVNEKKKLLKDSTNAVINLKNVNDSVLFKKMAEDKILLVFEFDAAALKEMKRDGKFYSNYRYAVEKPEELLEQGKIRYLDIDGNIQQKKEALEHLKTTIDAKEAEIKALNEKYKKKNIKYKKIKGDYDNVKKFELLVQDQDNQDDNRKIEIKANPFKTFDKVIEHIKKVFENKGFYYDDKVLKSFYLGLQTDQLILLMGRPGSGKTSLVREFADVFGIKYENIAVQANWTDRSDLLGYYNPIEKSYVSTLFLDRLLKFWREAKEKENEDKLYFICLDEMNLSHIEYYFADFLTVLQEPDLNKRKIQLYSKHLRDSILKELQFIKIADEDISESIEHNETVSDEKWNEVYGLVKSQADILKQKYYFELCRSLKMLCDFPYELNIPPNIKFIGTLNQDETTLDISPKVIDRSFVIRFDNAVDHIITSESGEKDNQKYEKIEYKHITDYEKKEDTKIAKIEIFNVGQLYGETNNETKKNVIGDVIRYSKRMEKQTFSNDEYQRWCQIMGKTIVDDLLIASTVLPRIRYVGPTDYEYIVKELRGIIKDDGTMPKSNQVLNEILDETGKEIAFWRS